MSYKIIVENYGKIKNAEIEVAPLTLFVGDNNSGKSFMSNLLWAFSSGEIVRILREDIIDIVSKRNFSLMAKLIQIADVENHPSVERVTVHESEIIELVNEALEKNKDNIVKRLFNYEGMKIGKIAITTDDSGVLSISRTAFRPEVSLINIAHNDEETSFFRIHKGFDRNLPENYCELIAGKMIEQMIGLLLKNGSGFSSSIYLPAARTGFMLAKNSINQTGRNKAFNLFFEEEGSGKDNTTSPLPKSIIHFLDTIESLEYENSIYAYPDLVEWVMSQMTKGDIVCTDENSVTLQYFPNGSKNGLPLRTTSGVITELSPLLLLLKYCEDLKHLYYEEPEMCLHPQLQVKMARLLVNIVNAGINITATTHSDIIIQHINNMCQLNGAKDEVLKNFQLDESDVLDINKVAIYEFHDCDTFATVDRIQPQNNQFHVPTFVDALSKILQQTMDVSEFVDGKEE